MEIYYTSDTHSYVYPTDYVSREDKAAGYMVLSSMFKDDALKIDGGDVLQGSPLVRFEMKSGNSPLMAAKAFNAAGLDVFVPGNHDFDFGYEMLRSFTSSLDAEVVCANLHDEMGFLKIKPYTVIEKDGVKAFITGAVTDYVNVWDKDKLGGLRITDSVNALKEVLKEKDAAAADFRICIYHGGFGNERGAIRENRADEIIPLGFDYLLTGHQHQVIEPRTEGRTTVLQTGWRGEWAAELSLQIDGSHSERMIRCSSSLPLSPSMATFAAQCSEENEAVASLSDVIGHVDGVLEDRGYVESALYGSSLADFICDIELKLTGADVAVAALANNFTSVGPDVTLSAVLASYPFTNTMVLLRMRAGDLREAMERSAEYIDIIDGVPAVSPSFAPGKNERYNFDLYRGLDYAFDYRKEKGSRVVRMERNGVDLLANPDTLLLVAVNGYRATGSGGHVAYRRGELVRSFSEDMQDLMIDSLSSFSLKVPSPSSFRSYF